VTPNNNPAAAISPDDVRKAYEERRAQGLDPGFFLQPTQQSNHNVLTDSTDRYEQKRLAALHAQEQYDKIHGGPPPSDDEDDDKEGEEVDDEQQEWTEQDGVVTDEDQQTSTVQNDANIVTAMDVT
jgi:hypothetical protein